MCASYILCHNCICQPYTKVNNIFFTTGTVLCHFYSVIEKYDSYLRTTKKALVIATYYIPLIKEGKCYITDRINL